MNIPKKTRKLRTQAKVAAKANTRIRSMPEKTDYIHSI